MFKTDIFYTNFLMNTDFLDKKFENKPSNTSIYNIRKTHNLPINSLFKPFVPIDNKYIKYKHNNHISSEKYEKYEYILKIKGDFFSNFKLNIKISEFNNNKFRLRYINNFGEKIIEKVQLMINNKIIDEYDYEYNLINYYFNLDIKKKMQWDKNLGNTKKTYIKYLNNHNMINLYIDLLFDFNKINKALPESILKTREFKLIIYLNKINNLVKYEHNNQNKNNKNSINYTDYLPKYENIDLYINNIYIYKKIKNILLQEMPCFKINRKLYKKINLTNNNDTILISDIDDTLAIKKIYICIKPKENENNPDNWFNNYKFTQNTIEYKIKDIIENEDEYIINYNKNIKYKKIDIINKVNLFQNNKNIYPTDDINFHNNINGWIEFKFNITDKYEPSGYIEFKKNIYLSYELNKKININDGYILCIYLEIIKGHVFN